MLQTDEDALRVVELVNHARTKFGDDVGEIGNIFLLFAHDLIIHFTGILLHRSAECSYEDNVRFPFISKSYAKCAYPISGLEDVHYEKQIGFNAAVSQLRLSQVAVGQGLPIDPRREWFTRRWITLLGCAKPFTRTFLPAHSIQIQALNELIQNLCKEFEIQETKTIWDNWYRYVVSHTTESELTCSENGVIIGTRNNLQNRKLAINYLQQGRKVVAVTHGEVANSVMDEPSFGYSERSLCSILVDYGAFDESGQYNHPWVIPQQTIYRSGVLSGYVYRAASEIRFPRKKNARGLYIPTIYHGNTLYGPFHVFEDIKYRRWHSLLFASIEGLTFKVHPKSRSKLNSGIAVEQRAIEQCIEDYDYLVFDYFATGAMLGLMSTKPVVYFDIGLRNLHPMFLADLKKRCEYVKINLETIDKDILGASLLESLSCGRIFTNEVMKKYVFSSAPGFRWYDLFSSLDSGK